METLKFDEGKVCFSDIPQLALESVAKVFNYGAKKYSKFNYSGGTDLLRYYDACQRHLHAWMTGKDIDESTHNHIDHAIASLMMLRENLHLNRGRDNRNKVYLNTNKMGDGDYQKPNPPTIDDYPYWAEANFFITRGEMSILVQEYPNDADLGRELRRRYNTINTKKPNVELEKEMD